MNLSSWQRIKRRISLWGRGSYQHPDGTIELDIDEKAGVDPTSDSEAVQDAKLRRYLARQARDERRDLGVLLVSLAVLIFVSHFDLPRWQSAVIAGLTGAGLYLLAPRR